MLLKHNKKFWLQAASAAALGGRDPFTMVLLHFDGTNGFSSFLDSSGKGHDFVPQNGALITTKKSKFGNSCIFVTSTQSTAAGGIFGDGSADFAIGTGDFVLDFWYQTPAFPTPTVSAVPLIDFGHDTNTNTGGVWLSSGGNPFYITNPSGGISGTITLSLNTWAHIAVVRSSGTTRLFVNGVKSGPDFADTISYTNIADAPGIGVNPAGNFSGAGYFDEIRLSKGTDRGWSGGFTPPTSPYTADANTHLLMHCEGAYGSLTFTDDSSQAHTFAVSGGSNQAVLDTSQSKFGGASLHIVTDGLSYMAVGDGSSDLALGSGNFVVDFWVRPVDFLDSFPVYLDWGFVEIGNSAPYLTVSGTGVLQWFANNTQSIVAGTGLSTGVWTHVAIVRSSGQTKMFLNGVQTGSTFTDTNNYAIGPIAPAIGGFANHIHNSAAWFDEFRISKGTDRGWSGGFTPPSSPY